MANEVLTKLAGGMLRYSYASDDDDTVAFEAFALAAIAEPYKQRFRAEIDDQNWIVEYDRHVTESPHTADFLICTADAAF